MLCENKYSSCLHNVHLFKKKEEKSEGGRKGRSMLMIYTINIYQTQEFAATGKVVAFVSQTSGGGGGGGAELGHHCTVSNQVFAHMCIVM